jgi:hypothetical protein
MPSRHAPAIVPIDGTTSTWEERTVQRILISEAKLVEEPTDEELLIQAWRAEQLRGLGLPRLLAETFAALVDWHAIAALVARGCSPELVLERLRIDAIELYQIHWPIANEDIKEGWTAMAEPSAYVRASPAMETAAA